MYKYQHDSNRPPYSSKKEAKTKKMSEGIMYVVMCD